jgi:hypothetical protein
MPSDVYAHGNAYSQHCRKEGRTAVGHKQKRNAGYRHDSHRHADVNEKMKAENSGKPGADICGKGVGGQFYHPQKAKADNQKKYENDNPADKAGFFGKN